MIGSRLQLAFVAVSESDMLLIMNHYLGQQGGHLSFVLPPEVLSGFNAADFTLTSYGWRYADSPAVDEVGCDRYTIKVKLESVSPG